MRHIDIQYFLIKDCIERGEVKIEYCQTDDMIADYTIKPLQGAKFYKFRKIILNLLEMKKTEILGIHIYVKLE